MSAKFHPVNKRLAPTQLVQQFLNRKYYAGVVKRAQATKDTDTDTDEDEHKRKILQAGEQFASRKKGKHRGRPKGATVGGNPRYSGKKGLGSTNQPDNFRTKNQDLVESKKENTMDFHELNKKMNDSKYQYNEGDYGRFVNQLLKRKKDQVVGLEKAMAVADAKEWSGDAHKRFGGLAVNFSTMAKAARTLAREVNRLQGIIEDENYS
jgi:hypothetical protein